MRIIKTLLIASLSFVPFLGQAITLEEAYLKAKQNDPGFRANIANINSLQTMNQTAFNDLLPQVGLQARTAEVSVDNDRIIGQNDYSLRELGIRAEQSLFRPDQWFNYRTAVKQDELYDIQKVGAEQALIQKVVDQYFNVQESHLRWQFSDKNTTMNSLFTELARVQQDLGVIDSNRINLALSNEAASEAETIATKQLFELEHERYFQIVGEYMPLVQLQDVYNPLCVSCLDDYLELQKQQQLVSLQELQTAGNKAISDAQYSQAFSGFLPQINAYANYGKRDSAQFFVTQNGLALVDLEAELFEVGFELTWPLFLGGSNLTRVKAAAYRKEAAQLELVDVKYEVQRQLALAEMQYAQSKKLLEAQLTSYQYAKKGLEAEQEKLRLGSASKIDVSKSRSNLLQAEYQQALTKFNVLRAWMQVLALHGLLSEDSLKVASEALAIS